MGRPKKESEYLHCRLEKKVSDDLKKFCSETDLSKTAAVERALRAYLQRYKKTKKI